MESQRCIILEKINLKYCKYEHILKDNISNITDVQGNKCMNNLKFKRATKI